MSPEEVRFQAYQAMANGTLPQHKAEMNQKLNDVEEIIRFSLQDPLRAARYLDRINEATRPFGPVTTAVDSRTFGGPSSSSSWGSGATTGPFGGSAFGNLSKGTSSGSSSSAFGTASSSFGSTSNPSQPAFGATSFLSKPKTSAFGSLGNTLSSSNSTSVGSVFGGNSQTTSAYGNSGQNSTGFGSHTFGSKPATSSSPFGTAAGNSGSIFGNTGLSNTLSSSSSNAFGQSTFGKNETTTATMTSSPFGIFGQLKQDSTKDTSTLTSSNPFAVLSDMSSQDNKPKSRFGEVRPQNEIFGTSSGQGAFTGQVPQQSAFGATTTSNPSPFNMANSAPTSPFSRTTQSFGTPNTASPFASSPTAFGNSQNKSSAFGGGFNSSTLAQASSASEYQLFRQGADDEPPPQLKDIDNEEVIAAFMATSFTLGKIPELVPPLELR